MPTLSVRALQLLTPVTISVLALVSPASATMKVVASDVPEIAVDSEWADDATLPVPPGKSVRVLLLPSKVTKVITGADPAADESKDFGGTRAPQGEEPAP